MEKFLNIFFIPNCVFCGAQGSFFCSKCLRKCVLCESVVNSAPYCAKFFSVYEYAGLVRECSRLSKYRNKQFAALKVLAQEAAVQLVETVAQFKDRCNGEIIYAPIPVTRRKMSDRGFNQAELIGQIFAKVHKINCCPGVLVRTKETFSQYKQNKKERLENLKDAFAVKNANAVFGKTVLLVDDICTTGATFNTASGALRKAGAKNVVCLALSRKA